MKIEDHSRHARPPIEFRRGIRRVFSKERPNRRRFIRTRLVQDSIDLNPDPAAAEASMVRGVALGRIADPSEEAAAIVLLASDNASYITGASLLVDGRLTARRAG